MAAASPQTPGGGGGKLESLSKEDVIKFAKRQTMLLSKAKEKINELSKSAAASSDAGTGSAELESVKQEKLALETSLRQIIEEKDILKGDLDDTREQLLHVKSRFSDSEGERLEAVTAYQSLQATLDEAVSSRQQAVAELQTLQQQYTQLQSQNRVMEEENDCLKMQHTSTLESVKAIQSEYQKVSEEKIQLANQNETMSKDLAESNRLKEKLVVNFKALKQKYLEMKKELDESKASVDQSADESSSSLNVSAVSDGAVEALQTKLETLQSDYDKQTTLLSQTRSELDEANKTLTENAPISTQPESEEDAVASEEGSGDPSQIQEIKKQLDLLTEENKQLIQSHEAEVKSLTEELAETKQTYSQSKDRAEELVLGLGKESASVISQYEDKIRGYESEREQLLNQIQNLQTEIGSDNLKPVEDTTDSASSPEVDESTITATESQNTESVGQSTSADSSQSPLPADSSDAEKAALLESVYQDLQAAKAELSQEKQLSKSLQDMLKTLSDNLRQLEDENSKLKSLSDTVRQLEDENSKLKASQSKADESQKGARSKTRNETRNDSSQLNERVRVLESSHAEKDEEIATLNSKIAELVEYASKLKAKCQMLLESMQERDEAITRLERRLASDARGARNLEQHFQESENTMNEQLAHFHEQRDEMIEQVREYARSIETLRAQMMPIKHREKQASVIMYKGLCFLADTDPDEEKIENGNVLELAKMLIDTACKYRGQADRVTSDHEKIHTSHTMMRRLCLNWKARHEEEVYRKKRCEDHIAKLEEKLGELGADPAEVPRDDYARVPSDRVMTEQDLDEHAHQLAESERNRVLCLSEEQERTIRALRIRLREINAEQETHGVQCQVMADTGSKETQTEVWEPSDLQCEINALSDVIGGLRLELTECRQRLKQFDEVKAARQQETVRMAELNARLETQTTQLAARDRDNRQQSSTIRQLQEQIDAQSDSIVDLKIKLSKDQIKEEFGVKTVEISGKSWQALLNTCIVELTAYKKEKALMRQRILKLEKKTGAKPDPKLVVLKPDKDLSGYDPPKEGAERIAQLEDELLVAYSTIEKMDAQMKDAVEKLNESQEKAPTPQTSADNAVDKLGDDSESKQQRGDNAGRIVELQTELEDLRSITEELRRAAATSTESVEDLSSRLQTSQQALEERTAEVERLNTELASVTEEKSALKKQYEEERNKSAALSILLVGAKSDAHADNNKIHILATELKITKAYRNEEHVAKMKKLTETAEEWENKYKEGSEKLKESSEKLKESSEKVRELEKEMEVKEETIKSQLLQIEELQTETTNLNARMEAQINDMREEAALLTRQKVDIESEKEDVLSRLKDLEMLRNTDSSQQQELGAVAERLQGECRDAKSKVSELNSEIQTMTESLSGLVSENTDLKQQLENKNSEVAALTGEIKRRDDDIDARSKDLQMQQQALDELKILKTSQQEQIQVLVEDLDTKKQELAKMKSDSDNYQAEIEELTKKTSQQDQAINQMREEFEAVRSEYEQLLTEKNGSKEEISLLTAEMESHKLKAQSVSQESTSMYEELKSTNKELTSTVERLQSEVTNQTEKLEAKEKDLEDLEANLQSLQSALIDLRTTRDDKEEENNRLKIELKEQNYLLQRELEHQSESQKVEIEKLSIQSESLKSENNTLISQLEAQQSEIDRLSNQNSELLRELETARREVMESSMSSQTSALSEEMAADSSTKLKEMEDRANKFKLLALKAKKELTESRATVEKLKTELSEQCKIGGNMQSIVTNYQHLQTDFDRLQDDLDTEKEKVATLQGQLESEQTTSSQIQSRLSQVIEEKENLSHSNGQLQAKIKSFESQQTELKAAMLCLEKECDNKQVEINEVNKSLSKMTEQSKSNESSNKSLEEKLRSKIAELELKVHEARDELAQANKTMSKSSLMDLEIADFERTVSKLQSEVRDKVEIITNLKQEVEHEQQKCATLESELATADEQMQSTSSRYDNLQQMLSKTREELDESRAHESESKSTDLAVRAELEVLRQQHEDLKLEMSNLSSHKLSAEDKLKSSQDSQQRLIRSMENKQRTLQSDLENSRSELTTLQEEYDHYKVRVHSVLKQQQTRASVEAALESEKVEKEHLQEVLNQVKLKLQETTDKLAAALSESGLLQDEIDKLSLRQNKQTQDYSNKEAILRQRIEQLMLENSTISSEHNTAISQMSKHTEIMTQTFKQQMQTSQTEHETHIASLNNKIDRQEEEKGSLMSEIQNLRQQLGSLRSNEQGKPSKLHRKQNSSTSLATASDVKYITRESGEGMEHPQPAQITQANMQQQPASGPGSNTLVGLEALISSQHSTPDDDSVSVVSASDVTSQSNPQDVEMKLKSRLQLSEKQLEHLRELLNDSEATCMRYNEQVKILKQEIRRLESNQQRENSISNMEYLKNIVYKFLSLEAGDERARLLPVLHTMLKFTEEELSKLRGIAAQGADDPAASQAQGSWSGYIHRWTGFSS